MRLKYAITIGDPKSAQIVAYQARSTGNSHLTREDVVTSLGVTQSRCRAGISLIYAKYTKDGSSTLTAFTELLRYALSQKAKYIPASQSINAAVEILCSLVLEDFCRTIDTPGARCLCGGKGEVRDMKLSRRTGKPVMKKCSRCHGTGLRPLNHSRCHHALNRVIQISQSTYSRYWRQFYDALLAWCIVQGNRAEAIYNAYTSLNPLLLETKI
ncbi:antitermination protein [Klebsiella oxytoca]|uniref:antitermination protein n=1 Tax=Klebsiella oxytoca TaxID=571 RepID=UPI001CCBB746|nr:antitermination protein [Klebsiella oxytoca]MBZ7262459.1 antitermination protein [Klebsiella oxytoca]